MDGWDAQFREESGRPRETETNPEHLGNRKGGIARPCTQKDEGEKDEGGDGGT